MPGPSSDFLDHALRSWGLEFSAQRTVVLAFRDCTGFFPRSTFGGWGPLCVHPQAGGVPRDTLLCRGREQNLDVQAGTSTSVHVKFLTA